MAGKPTEQLDAAGRGAGHVQVQSVRAEDPERVAAGTTNYLDDGAAMIAEVNASGTEDFLVAAALRRHR